MTTAREDARFFRPGSVSGLGTLRFPGMRHTILCLLISLPTLAHTGCGGHRAGPLAAPSPVYSSYSSHTAAADVATAAPSGESYQQTAENQFHQAAGAPVSTFSIDVDTASYSNVRRFLESGSLPPKDAVRIEELINYFDYTYPQPAGDAPFSVISEVAPAPWRPDNLLVHVGLQGRAVDPLALPPRNLVFLLDVSGSMHAANKLPLLQNALSLLVDQLGEADRVSIVAYAGATGVVLPPTPGSAKQTILSALRELRAGGSTNGGAGIELAYALAEENLVPGAVNRVILATDGDFNVGITDRGALVRLIEAKRERGVQLTVLGFGMGNLKDATMENLADKGNGNYAYIDSISEARKVLVTEAGGTLVTIAKDVKIQVAFDPAQVASYRLIGYENRVLANRDFTDDTKDAGEIGAGHSVTALYEIALTDDAVAGVPMMTVKLRYKHPGGDTSVPMEAGVIAAPVPLAAVSDDFRFAAAVAGFGMLLRDSEHKGAASFAQVAEIARGALGTDEHGYRRKFLDLVAAAERLHKPESTTAQAY
jgi:Ca-activated chloride channel family protein